MLVLTRLRESHSENLQEMENLEDMSRRILMLF